MVETDKNAGKFLAKPVWLLFFASFCLYSLTSSPSMGWLDSPEFIAQAATLGIAHSPGHPLPALLGRLATLIPIGDMVWRINLMSGVCAAGSISIFYLCAVEYMSIIAPKLGRHMTQALSLVFSCLLAVSWAMWSNALRSEVYALQSLLSCSAILALLHFHRMRQTRFLLVSSFCLALGLANHHFLTLILLIPAGVFVLRKSARPSFRALLWTAAVGCIGLLALAYLPIRSLAHPIVNFGAPHTLERLFWTIRGAAFTKSTHTAHASSPFLDFVQILIATSQALTLPLLVLSLVGLVQQFRQRKEIALAFLLFGIAIFCMAARVLLGFDPETPDHHAYLLPAIFALFLLALSGVAGLCQLAMEIKRPLPKAPMLTLVSILLTFLIQITSQWPQTNAADSWASDDLAHWEIQKLPPRSLLLLAYFRTNFRMAALETIEGARPDLTILDRSFLTYPGMSEEAVHHHPYFRSLIETPLRAGSPSPLHQLQTISKDRPVFIELHINVDLPLAKRISPAGAFARFDLQSSKQTELIDSKARDTLATLLESSNPADKIHVKAALLWRDAMRLDQLCIIGRKSYAALVFANTKTLAPTDSELQAMAKRCGLIP